MLKANQWFHYVCSCICQHHTKLNKDAIILKIGMWNLWVWIRMLLIVIRNRVIQQGQTFLQTAYLRYVYITTILWQLVLHVWGDKCIRCFGTSLSGFAGRERIYEYFLLCYRSILLFEMLIYLSFSDLIFTQTFIQTESLDIAKLSRLLCRNEGL